MREYLPEKPNMLKRDRIGGLLDYGMNFSLMTVVAGPGYGKTQAISSWAKTSDRRLIWLGLASHDNDAGLFWTHLTDAVKREASTLAGRLRQAGFPDTPDKALLACRQFYAEAQHGRPILFVVDNANAVDNPAVRSFFTDLIRCGIPGLCLLLISNKRADRAECELCCPRPVYSLSSSEMAFTPDEVKAYFKSFGFSLPGHMLFRILSCTEGWPLAVHLVGGQLRRGMSDCLAMRERPSGIDDLFYDNYLKPCGLELQAGLIEMASHSRISRDAVLNAENGESSGLLSLVDTNPFIHYCKAGDYYRFHYLFRMFLQERADAHLRERADAHLRERADTHRRERADAHLRERADAHL